MQGLTLTTSLLAWSHFEAVGSFRAISFNNFTVLRGHSFQCDWSSLCS